MWKDERAMIVNKSLVQPNLIDAPSTAAYKRGSQGGMIDDE
jgi:hypothetical protein